MNFSPPFSYFDFKWSVSRLSGRIFTPVEYLIVKIPQITYCTLTLLFPLNLRDKYHKSSPTAFWRMYMAFKQSGPLVLQVVFRLQCYRFAPVSDVTSTKYRACGSDSVHRPIVHDLHVYTPFTVYVKNA